jgi:CAAX prenyl protease-like protein
MHAEAKVFILPFVLYLVGTTFIARFGDAWYPLLYSLVVAVVAAVLFRFLWRSGIVRPHWKVLPGVAFGILGIAMWIFLCSLSIEQRLGEFLPSWLQPDERVGYNPFEQLQGTAIWAFIAVRMLGIAVVVPLAEELFWRGFLMRWLIDPAWEKVPIGEYTASSCAIVTLMFTLAHPEWIAAATYCLLINGLLYWKKDLWQCIVAHAVSNLSLAVYVLVYGAWALW